MLTTPKQRIIMWLVGRMGVKDNYILFLILPLNNMCLSANHLAPV